MLKQLNRFMITALSCAALSAAAVAEEAWEFSARINRGTVSVISGGINGTYIRIATDLSSVLDNGEDLRVLPIMGKGSVQNIDDILYLKGIDVGIVQSDVLEFVKQENKHPTIEERIRYITKLYNEEFHLLANSSITGIEDLAGKQVNFGVEGSGTYMTASLVFDKLGVEAEPVSYDQSLALEKVKSGEIAALVYVAGKPTQLFKEVAASDNLHLLEIPLNDEVLDTYLPSRFTHEDYPELVASGEIVRTLAVGAVMVVYNWKSDSPRYAKAAHFVESFFDHFNEFRQVPRHPKWQEVSLSAEVPGWTRFAPAEAWLRKARAVAAIETSKPEFEDFLEAQEGKLANPLMTAEQKEALFKQFLQWNASHQQ